LVAANKTCVKGQFYSGRLIMGNKECVIIWETRREEDTFHKSIIQALAERCKLTIEEDTVYSNKITAKGKKMEDFQGRVRDYFMGCGITHKMVEK